VLPPDEFIEHLIKQKKMDITVAKVKELLQSLLEVLPLSEQDPARLQVEREFQKGESHQVSCGSMPEWSDLVLPC